jgi:hypothetical protein
MRLVTFLIGVLLGVILLGVVRFARIQAPEGVHYHANWAVFVDGQRLDLSGGQYMEDIAACSMTGPDVPPAARVHMHDSAGSHDVVHVHHPGATWGHLMNNLGLTFGDHALILPDGRRFIDGEDGRTFKFVVKGLPTPELQNRLIRSEDRVLISIGSESADEVMASQFPQVAATAAEYNAKDDPATCSGSTPHWTFGERLHHAFWD